MPIPRRRRREARRRARLVHPRAGRHLRDRRARRARVRRAACALAGGETLGARRAVICNVTPTQLYGDLLGGTPAAVPLRAGGDADPLRARPSRRSWEGDERLGKTAIVHLTPGLDGVSRAVNEAERGLLPAEATVVVGQPLTMDPSRAPDGKGLLWVQLQELPWQVKGDAAGELDSATALDGRAARALRRPHPGADRDATSRTSSRRSLAARRASRRPTCRRTNINLVHGDPYGGSLALDQNFLWRAPHRTQVPGVWHVGASTHPGPGPRRRLRCARRAQLLEPPLPQRLLGRFRR